jgi:hypothetical protein
MWLKSAIIGILVTLLGHCCYAQAWGGGADQNDLSFGFSFQYVTQDFKIVRQPGWIEQKKGIYDPELGRDVTSPLTSISSKSIPGFTVGFITRYRVAEHFEVRTTPALVFADRELSYTFEKEQDNLNRQIQTTSIDVPLLLKLRSDMIGNVRAYILGGAKYSFAVSRGKPETNEGPLRQRLMNKRGIASYEAGFGFDIYFEFFKMSPEIKVANSFGNVLVGNNVPLAAPINKLFLHSLMFSLHFE